MRALFRRLLSCERGVTAIEYGAIAALVSLAVIAGATAMGESVLAIFEQSSDAISAATPTP